MTNLTLDLKTRDELILEMCLPKSITVESGGSVDSGLVRAVMFRFDKHLGNREETFVGIALLSKATGKQDRQVRRAIEALVSLGVVSVTFKKSEQSRKPVNHYKVHWDRVRELGIVEPHPEHETGSEESDMSRGIGHETSRNRTYDTEESDMRGGGIGHETGGNRTSDVQRPLDHGLDHGLDTIDHGGDGDFQNGSRKETKTVRLAKPSNDGMPKEIPERLLTDPHNVEAIWKGVVKAGSLPETEHWRRAFYAVCHAVCRVKSIKSPGRVLRHRMKQCREFGYDKNELRIDDAHDDAWAQKAIATVDGRPLVGMEGHQGSSADPGAEESEKSLDPTTQAYALNLLTRLESAGYRDDLSENDLERLRTDPREWLSQNRERFPGLLPANPTIRKVMN